MRSASTQVEQGASEGALWPTDGHPRDNHNKRLQRSRVTSSAGVRYLVCSFVLEAGGCSLSHARPVGSSQTQHAASGLHLRVQSPFLRGRFQPSTVHLRSSGCHGETGVCTAYQLLHMHLQSPHILQKNTLPSNVSWLVAEFQQQASRHCMYKLGLILTHGSSSSNSSKSRVVRCNFDAATARWLCTQASKMLHTSCRSASILLRYSIACVITLCSAIMTEGVYAREPHLIGSW